MSKNDALTAMASLDEVALDDVQGGLSLGFTGYAIGLVGSTQERGYAVDGVSVDAAPVGWHGLPVGNAHGALSLLAAPEAPPVGAAPVAPIAPPPPLATPVPPAVEPMPATPVEPVAPVAPPVEAAIPPIEPITPPVDPITPPVAPVTPPPTPSSSSFFVQSFGDPHVQVMIDGVVHEQIDYGPSIANFENFANTVGGATTVSTSTYNLSGDTHITVNHDVTIASEGGWSVNVDGEGHVAVTTGAGTQIVDASGNQTFDLGATDVTVTQDHVTVAQTLADGGTVTTVFDVHRGAGGIGGYVDVESIGHGDAGLGGWVTQDHHGDAFATYGAANYDHTVVV